MTLGPQPYYWPNTETVSYGGSPPIATRSGWMALALLPFVLALSAKANLISTLTGVPHEKLQVFHHWTSYAMFVLALVHTFPFIIYHIDQGDMVDQWKTEVTYWTGVAAIIPQAYLTFMSLPAIRNRFYEFFKATHFLAALVFIVFFFLHCDFRLSSWDYFISAGAIYILSLWISNIRTYFMHGRHTATIEHLPCGLVRIRIPTIMAWRPGQHVFVRFFSLQQGIHCLSAHPFTICSLYQDFEQTGKAPEIIFYVKPRRGLTASLGNTALEKPNSSETVLLEGPYGGISESVDFARFDSYVMITGGTGGGFSLAIFEAALRTHHQQQQQPTATIQVHFATRTAALADWYREQIKAKLAAYNVSSDKISLSIHVTTKDSLLSTPASGSPLIPDSVEKRQPGDSVDSVSSQVDIADTVVQMGNRPDIAGIIAASTTSNTSRRIAIFTCGPGSMIRDVRNAAAEAQCQVLKKGSSVEEVYLHTESFSW
ncbi:ferric-chelate reductase [Aspergillus eucalypticola CBS 122712]|uniref:ferric-chelate reductase (NADPH) n=1 Tax=Aspergillus eucalypticola (strain CBS 122712 / IBT 29274) TaxID=1448314 RepID=A0A317VU66_ASPEC|nr:ferric-chelate reductase [Aspergillus eucalypticola CBS 122712]PWY77914.1 ferric-chelate reductase [Aspergillus eucalypticola CBS 122712]